MTNPQTLGPLNLAFKITTAVQPVPCVETNGAKYEQDPNLYNGGYDVWNSSPQPVQLPAADGPWWLADDFVCTNAGFITDIHLWGSWQYNSPLSNTITFQLYVFDDVPTNAVNPFSHPGTNVLWHQTFTPGSYAESLLYTYANESFLDPGLPQIYLGPDSNVWYYCFYPTGLYQNGSPSAPTNYWLAAFAELPTCVTNVFGWKSTMNVQHDISVRAQWTGYNVPPPNNAWQPNFDFNDLPFDLAFKLTTQTNPPGPCCPETNGLKYIQHPNLTNGVDVDATINFGWVLADDFLCTNSGPITDIHLWGSWLHDQVDLNASYTLTIWSDVPAPPTGGTFSHPGVPLWSQTFTPGNYAICPGPSLQEGFYDPISTTGLAFLGFSTNLYYLCFNVFPTNTFCQAGTPTAQTNYWLSVSAQSASPTAPDYFGWKSSSDAYGDAAVAANGFGPQPPPAAWYPLFDPSGTSPLNFAFKLTTATNSAVSINCAGDKTIECGSTLSFDPPIIVGSDPCCQTPPGWKFYFVTNSTALCHQVYTGYWTITNCNGVILKVCTQTVTVQDTNPPVLYCTNLVLACGDHSYTNPPAAYDTCCGTNVTVTPLTSLVINSNCGGQTISQTWLATDCCTNSAQCGRLVYIVAGLGNNFVVPNTNANVEGNSNNRYPFDLGGAGLTSLRYQQVYASSQFGAVPPGGAFITALAFRVGAGWGAFAATLPNVQIDLSTTPKVPDGLDTTFANNVGPDDTIVYSGALTLSSVDGGSPTPFDIIIPLTTPFWYDPPAGDLLLDVRNFGGGSSQPFDAVFATNDSVSRVWGPVGSSTGGTDTVGLVTEFTLDVNTISLNCPSNIVVCTCSNTPVVVSWPTDVAKDYCTSVTVTSAPPSPALFLPNTTNTVVLSAHDACGNSNGCTFTVAVVRPVLGSISVTRTAPNNIQLTWDSCGILQVSTYITNTNWLAPFVDVPGATSPWPVSTLSPVARYYRLRCLSP
jgi:hypothetical protein